MRECLRRFRPEILKVRKPDVDYVGNHGKRFDAFIAARIPDNRNRKPLLLRLSYRFGDRKRVVTGRDEIHICRAFPLKFEEDFRKAGDCNRSARVPAGDCAVLAEDAVQRAARKEHRAGAGFPADARFFPHMKRRPCHADFIGAAADAARSSRAVRAALSWAETAAVFLIEVHIESGRSCPSPPLPPPRRIPSALTVTGVRNRVRKQSEP